MKKLRLFNNVAGWIVFSIALTTYAVTMERTASFWDCGEFIAAAFKLEVPHPPGAPFFLLMGRLFALIAGENLLQVAFWINMLSVICSAFTILFLFWTITLVAGKIIIKENQEPDTTDIVSILSAGIIGALCYTWSDSFWFSATEAEVYAMSSFFTAIVIWAFFKWERIEDPALENRWLILIAFLVGISIGVHLLNLVTIPALALLFYFKKYPNPTFFGGILAFISGLLVLATINSGIITGLPELAGKFEIFFVNSLGLPFNSGVVFFIVFLFGSLVGGIFYSQKKNHFRLNTGLLCFAFILLGNTTYLMVLIRSNYNTPINENSPNDVLSFVSYLKREQYGSRPLAYGPSFVAQPTGLKKLAPVYKRSGNQYKVVDHLQEYEYAPGDNMLLPRLYSVQDNHAQLYRSMLGLAEGQKPSMLQNLSFLFSYQMGHMYWRYFFWNFAGRESDIEGSATLFPWQSAQQYPSTISANKAHDNYYMLPLVLGLIGLTFLFFKNKKDLIVLGLLFLLTGVALVIYLNSPPVEPRERDYIYVGSFYIFCVWIGIGVIGLARALNTVLRKENIRIAVAGAVCLIVPVMMGVKGWDNHDRRNRYFSVDFARNILNSCAPNAILFTAGDNDTFPLWYVQEVEGFRKDVRVCVQTYMASDWYISQLKRKINDSEPIATSLTMEQYGRGKNDYIPFYEIESVKGGINLKEYLELVKQNNQAIQVPLTSGEMTSIMPSSILFLPVDRDAVIASNIVGKSAAPYISDSISWNIGKKSLFKSDLVILDIISTNEWKRPIYFSTTLGQTNDLGLSEFMQLEGFTYRLLPAKIPGATEGYVNSDIMYNNMMNKMAWRELDNKKSYYDDTYRRSPVTSSRLSFLRLANQLVAENKLDMARKVADRAIAVMPDDSIPFDAISSSFAGIYFEVGENKKGLEIADTLAKRSNENLSWALSHPNTALVSINNDLFILNTLANSCKRAKQYSAAEKYEGMLRKHLNAFNYRTEG